MALGETATLAVQLNLNDKLTPGLAKTQAQVSRLQKATSGLKNSVLTGVGLGAGVAAFSLVTRGIGAVIDVMSDATRLAMEEEAGIAQLTRSIEENSAGWDGNIDRIEAVISARENLAFSDGEQRESLRALVAQTKNVDEALRVQAIAMDFARLRDIDLASATELLGKVYGGNVGILARYGIQLRKGATATEALAEIQKRATGQAAAYAETNQGKLVRSQIAVENAMERLGGTTMPLYADALTNIAGILETITGGGRSGLLDDFIKDLNATEVAAGEVSKDVTQNWALTGTVFDDLIDKAHGFREAAADIGLLPEFAKIREWTTELRPLIEGLGGTEDQLMDVIAAAQQAGRPIEEVRTELESLATVVGNRNMWAAMGAGMRTAADGAEELADTTEDATKETRKLTFSIFDASEAASLADQKFGKQRNSLRDLIRSTARLRRENDQTFPRGKTLLEQLATAHRKQAQAAKEGRADVVASYQAQINKIEDMLGPLRAALALTIRLRAQSILEAGFDSIASGILGAGRKGKNTGQNWSGGVLFPGDYGTLGERGPERVRNENGVTVIEPMARAAARQSINVTVRPVIPAYEINREIGRIGTTRRAGAGVL